MNNYTKLLFSLMTLMMSTAPLYAASYSLPSLDHSIIGQTQQTNGQAGDTVVTIAKQYDIGHNAIQQANPHVDVAKSFAAGTFLQIPTQHLLPNQAREGIVINLPEMRMYYFLKDSQEVLTYPIGIGKIGKTIPITKTSIIRKTINPTWTPPQDIREFNLEKGIVLPKVMPPGPDNPLGPYAIYMRLPTYLIHSTIFPESVGMRASFGCIRMYEQDIKEFFPSIEKNIPVAIINSPVKVGWEGKQLYIEIHQPLEEHQTATEASFPGIISMVHKMIKDKIVLVDWQSISYIAKEKDGIPHEIGMDIS